MKIVASILFLLLFIFQVQLWFGAHGLFELWSLQNNIDAIRDDNQQLIGRNETLHAEVQELKQGQEALEERARNQLGFIREGETFFRVVPEQSKATP